MEHVCGIYPVSEPLTVLSCQEKEVWERKNERKKVEVHTASFRLMGLLSSHSSWTVWMFPLAAEDKKNSQKVSRERKH